MIQFTVCLHSSPSFSYFSVSCLQTCYSVSFSSSTSHTHTHTHAHTHTQLTWIKAHAGHHGNELADQTVKEAATNSDIEYYRRIHKSTVRRELSGNSVIKWQGEWDNTTKGAITKSFFSQNSRPIKIKN